MPDPITSPSGSTAYRSPAPCAPRTGTRKASADGASGTAATDGKPDRPTLADITNDMTKTVAKPFRHVMASPDRPTVTRRPSYGREHFLLTRSEIGGIGGTAGADGAPDHPRLARYVSHDPTNTRLKPFLARSVSRPDSVTARLCADPKVGTVLLGRFKLDTGNLLHRLDSPQIDDVLDYVCEPGNFHMLNVSPERADQCDDFWGEINLPWLKRMADDGCIMVAVSDPFDDTVLIDNGRETIFHKELSYMAGREDYLFCDEESAFIPERLWTHFDVFHEAESDLFHDASDSSSDSASDDTPTPTPAGDRPSPKA